MSADDFVPDTAPDLSADSLSALTEAASFPEPGHRTFALSGLYRLSADAGLELEFTEILSLSRTLIYLSGGHDVFLSLPQGQYSLHYRRTSPAPTHDLHLDMQRLDSTDKLALYAQKAAQLARQPGRWRSVAQRLLHRRRDSALGLSLASAAPVVDANPFADRLPERPIRVSSRPAVSIIIPTKTRHDLLDACLDSLRRIEGVTIEIIIVDNGATTPEMLALLHEAALRPNVRVIRHDFAFNFSRLCNLGAAEARHPLLLFLNDDIEALDGIWLKAMIGYAAREDVGVVGARLLYASGDLQHAGVATNLVPGPGHPWRGVSESVWRTHPLLAQSGEVDAVTGACLLIRRDRFDHLGGFDETRFAITLNDVDLCLKARQAGHKVIYTPDATLLHKEGQSRPADNRPEEQARRDAELRAFVELYPAPARRSVFYPPSLRRDTDTGSAI